MTLFCPAFQKLEVAPPGPRKTSCMDDELTIRQTAHALNMSVRDVLRLVELQVLRPHRFGGQIRFRLEHVQAFALRLPPLPEHAAPPRVPIHA